MKFRAVVISLFAGKIKKIKDRYQIKFRNQEKPEPPAAKNPETKTFSDQCIHTPRDPAV